MAQIYHKKGDTLSLTITWTDSTGTPIDITGFTIESQVRANSFEDDLTVVITNAEEGQFILSASATDTALWPVTDSSQSRLFCDVQFTLGSVVTSSETFQIVVVKDITT